MVGTTDATNWCLNATRGDFWLFFGVKTGRKGAGVTLRLNWGVGAVGTGVACVKRGGKDEKGGVWGQKKEKNGKMGRGLVSCPL